MDDANKEDVIISKVRKDAKQKKNKDNKTHNKKNIVNYQS